MDKIDAVIAATTRARANGFGYAFAVQYNDGWQINDRKPTLRAYIGSRPAEVIECRDDGSRVIA